MTAETMVRTIAVLIMFWNLENFFYPQKNAEFHPGEKTITWKRFGQKSNKVSKTIIAIKDIEGQYPSLIGLCEVENMGTLKSLIKHTPLSRLGYRIIHKDSPDSRGIDVALLYRDDHFIILGASFLRVKSFRTRDILYAKMLSVALKDTLHVFVNHWPSKLGGEKKSLPKRMEVAVLLKSAVDSVLERNSSAKIVVMGDYNDSPTSAPLNYLANKGKPALCNSLINLSANLKDSLIATRAEIYGTHKYNGGWEMLDQFLVSSSITGRVSVLAFPHLLEKDKRYLGNKTRRTFTGPRFNGGASDHLPVLLKIMQSQKEHRP